MEKWEEGNRRERRCRVRSRRGRKENDGQWKDNVKKNGGIRKAEKEESKNEDGIWSEKEHEEKVNKEIFC